MTTWWLSICQLCKHRLDQFDSVPESKGYAVKLMIIDNDSNNASNSNTYELIK